MAESNKVIIIGSGIAGLAASIRLSVAGMTVDVYEKNPGPGGKLSDFNLKGYHFDSGPSLFTQPENVAELFELAGEPVEEYLSYRKLDNSCRYFFENGKVINAYTDAEKLAAELQAVAGEDPGKVKRYLSRSGKLYTRLGTIFINSTLRKLNTWARPAIIYAVRAIRLPYIFSSLATYNRKQFKSVEAQQVFNRFATYNGSNPYKAPAMLSMIPHLELNEGTYYPEGGMISITNALYQLAVKKGVKFHFNSNVSRIIHNGADVQGIVVNNENVFADTVISNADVYNTYKYLLRHEVKARNLLKQERSSSAIIFYWGISKSYAELGLHNIFFSNDYKAEFDCLFNKNVIHTDPTIYVNITSKMESSLAPEGKENWFVMVNVPSNTGQDWKALAARTSKAVIQKLNRMLQTDIEILIEAEKIMDPTGIEEATGSFRGSLYGSSSNSKLAAFSRPANFTSFAKRLYFCGGTVHPGGGIPLCLKSAKITAELVRKDIIKQQAS